MKKKTIVSLIGCSFALAFGAFAGVKANKTFEAKATGDTLAKGTIIYIDEGWNDAWINAWVYYTTGGARYETFGFDNLSGKNCIVLAEDATGMKVSRSAEQHTGNVWRDDYYSSNVGTFDFQSGKNYLTNNGYGSGDPSATLSGTWGTLSYELRNFTASSTLVMTDGFDSSGNHQASLAPVDLSKDTSFKLVTNYNGTVGSDNWYGYNNLLSGSGSIKDTYLVDDGTSDHNIKVNKAGHFEFYLKYDGGRKIWAQLDSNFEANEFAQEFMDATDDVCDDGNAEGYDRTDALVAIWNHKNDNSGLVDKWNSLSTGAHTVFAAGTASDLLRNAKARYIHLMQRYGSSLTAFENGPSYANTTISPLAISSQSNTAIIIVVISTISLIGLGAFFFIKRKKEN